MTVATHDSAAPPPLGRLLKEWRHARGMSQLDLALTSGISQRHLSFVESGRSRPSRGMVLNLASALALPLRQQNAMLTAAGFASAFRERPLDAPDMRPIDDALKRMLKQQEPFPAVVVDRSYNALRANDGMARLLAFLPGPAAEEKPAPGGPVNLLGLLFELGKLGSVVENWDEVATWVIRRLRAESLAEGAPAGGESPLSLVPPEFAALAREPGQEQDHPPTLVLRFRQGGVRLALFSVIATMGTPLDAALQEIRLEFFFPADEDTERWFRHPVEVTAPA